MIVHTILYVQDQKRSSEFYQKVLCLEPQLDVSGMTEFKLSEEHILGLMPEAGIKRILGDRIPDPQKGSGVPRAELYIRLENPEQMMSMAIEMGAREIDSMKPRDWGGCAGYVMDHDGHILAFAT